MEKYRFPQHMFSGGLSVGYRTHGGQRKKYKDQLKKMLVRTLTTCHLVQQIKQLDDTPSRRQLSPL